MKSKLVFCLIALACAGCSPIGPDYERPAFDMPENWKTIPGADPALWKTAVPADEAPKGDWWTAFGDKTLDELVAKCLENNFTLQSSIARLDQAISQSEARGAALLPTITAGAVASRSLTSANRPGTTYDAINYQTVQNEFRPVGLMTYEIDWLGKVRRDVEASRDTAEQAAADTQNVRLLLSAQVASSYFLLRQYDEEIRVLTSVVGLQEKLRGFFQKRYAEGASGRTEVSQQTALTETTGAQLEVVKAQRNAQENLLATLTGVPAANFSIPPGNLPTSLPAFPVSVPSELLERRPDIASAERAMAAANAQIGVAKAAFFPSLLVAPAFFGSDSTGLSTLFNTPSLIWAIGLTATQTIFDGGRTSANYRFAKAGYAGTVANYKQSILVAIQETQDAMSNLQQYERARIKQDEGVQNYGKALKISFIRYREGLDNAQTLALIQQTQLTALRVKWQLHGSQFLASVALVKALGGGWDGMKKPTSPVPPMPSDEEIFGLPRGGD
jgi:NodT family efflux transporter outer membrane factor (OMF) lipoprotein